MQLANCWNCQHTTETCNPDIQDWNCQHSLPPCICYPEKYPEFIPKVIYPDQEVSS
jgi:hypothetical protein